MNNKSNVRLSYQSYGFSILLFIQGDTDLEAYGKYLSLWNWNATSTGCAVKEYSRMDDMVAEGEKANRNPNCSSWSFEETPFVTTGVIAVWSTVERLQVYLFNQHLMKLWKDSAKGQKNGVRDEAQRLAEQEFDAIERESFRFINSNNEEYEMGVIEAEKPDDDFTTLCAIAGLQSK